jgi:hypothetical protein
MPGKGNMQIFAIRHRQQRAVVFHPDHFRFAGALRFVSGYRVTLPYPAIIEPQFKARLEPHFLSIDRGDCLPRTILVNLPIRLDFLGQEQDLAGSPFQGCSPLVKSEWSAWSGTQLPPSRSRQAHAPPLSWPFTRTPCAGYVENLRHANGFLTGRLMLDHFARLVACRRKQFGGLHLFRLERRNLSRGHFRPGFLVRLVEFLGNPLS